MHDDLILRLREAAKMSEALAVLLPHSEGSATAKLYNEAADAIEELQKRVPKAPHGRLIDADVLMHEFEKAQRTMEQHGQEYSCSFMSSSQEISTEWYCVEDMLENAPTILPAEEGE